MGNSRGSISAFVLCLVSTFVLLSGLALDGGRVINGYVRLSDIAENTARLGAQSVTGIRAGHPRVDAVRAGTEMDRFLEAFSLTGRYEISGLSVSVEVRKKIALPALSVVGVRSKWIRVRRDVVLVGG